MSQQGLSIVFLIQGPVAWDDVIKSGPSEIHGQSRAGRASELFY